MQDLNSEFYMMTRKTLKKMAYEYAIANGLETLSNRTKINGRKINFYNPLYMLSFWISHFFKIWHFINWSFSKLGFGFNTIIQDQRFFNVYSNDRMGLIKRMLSNILLLLIPSGYLQIPRIYTLQ